MTREVLIRTAALRGIEELCKRAAPKETIGFLIGRERTYDRLIDQSDTRNLALELAGKPLTYIQNFETDITISTQTHAQFSNEALGKISLRVRTEHRPNFVVGWYHSHPGYGCFLSQTDLRTQRLWFREWFHVAMVVDPVNSDVRFFKANADGRSYREVGAGQYDFIEEGVD